MNYLSYMSNTYLGFIRKLWVEEESTQSPAGAMALGDDGVVRTGNLYYIWLKFGALHVLFSSISPCDNLYKEIYTTDLYPDILLLKFSHVLADVLFI